MRIRKPLLYKRRNLRKRRNPFRRHPARRSLHRNPKRSQLSPNPKINNNNNNNYNSNSNLIPARRDSGPPHLQPRMMISPRLLHKKRWSNPRAIKARRKNLP